MHGIFFHFCLFFPSVGCAFLSVPIVLRSRQRDRFRKKIARWLIGCVSRTDNRDQDEHSYHFTHYRLLVSATANPSKSLMHFFALLFSLSHQIIFLVFLLVHWLFSFKKTLIEDKKKTTRTSSIGIEMIDITITPKWCFAFSPFLVSLDRKRRLIMNCKQFTNTKLHILLDVNQTKTQKKNICHNCSTLKIPKHFFFVLSLRMFLFCCRFGSRTPWWFGHFCVLATVQMKCE